MTFRGVLLINGVASFLIMALSVHAQQISGNAAPTSYEVVSIKLETLDPPAMGLRYTPTGFEAYAVTLEDLIKEAYGLPDVRLVKGASNIKPKYHIVAKLSDTDTDTLRSLSPQELTTERQLLLQALLADRFELVVHHASNRLPIYSLEVAKQGLKLEKVTPGSLGTSDASKLEADSFFSEGRIRGVYSMERLAHILSLMRKLDEDAGDRTVVDTTGLSGKYIVDLAWTGPSVQSPPMVSQNTEVYGSVISALDQAGLRLVPKTIDMDSVVVDHATMASTD